MSTTVVVPTVDRPGALLPCLESILAGDMLPDRIVVADQGGPTSTAVATLLDGLASPVPILRLPLLVRATSAARNAGSRAAASDLVAFIDDDCVADPGWLAALTKAFTKHGNDGPVAAVAGAVLPVDTGRGTVPVSSRAGVVTRRFVHRGRWGARPAWAPWDVGTGASLLVPARVLAAIGGFDEQLGGGTAAEAAEDVDLVYRAARHGVLVYEPAAVVHHPMTTRSARLRSRIRYGRGMGTMLGRHAARGDRVAIELASLYLRHHLVRAARGLPWSPVESALTLAGALPALLGAVLGSSRKPRATELEEDGQA